MRALFAQQADLASAITERDQPLRQQLDPQRPSVRFREISRSKEGLPILPQQFSHGCAGSDPRKQFIISGAQHVLLPTFRMAGSPGSVLKNPARPSRASG